MPTTRRSQASCRSSSRRRRKCSFRGTPSTTPVDGDETGDQEGEDLEVERIVFRFPGGGEDTDEEEDEEDVVTQFEELQLVSFSDNESVEDENLVPSRSSASVTETEGGRRSLAIPIPAAPASTALSPAKRSSPLSPTLLGNVQQDVPVPSPNPPTNNVQFSSVNNEQVPATTATTNNNKRRRDQDSSSSRRENYKKRRLGSLRNRQQEEEGSEVAVEPDQVQSSSTCVDAKCVTETSQNNKPTACDAAAGLPVADFRILDDFCISDAPAVDTDLYLKTKRRARQTLCVEVQYELDEVDMAWLETANKLRSDYNFGLRPIQLEEMELLIDRLEKENYFDLRNSGMAEPKESDEEAVCCVCLDGESDNSNQIIFCDLCNIAIHQDCYGVPFIPEGSWVCRRCESNPNEDIDCIFCPSKEGAFKNTVDGRWAHVVCALWIPEVRFLNPSLVDLVDDIDSIPAARYRLTCFLCKQKGVGTCIQCHLRSCVTAFHVTCAQMAGLSLKLQTKDSAPIPDIQMKAACDKHTSDKDRSILLQKVATMKEILQEKQSSVTELPSVPPDRLEQIMELVDFTGKRWFMRSLLAYWKLRRKNRGGSTLLQNLKMLYPEKDKRRNPNSIFHPEMPSQLFVPDTYEESLEDPLRLFNKMRELREELDVAKVYADQIKLQFIRDAEALDARRRADYVQLQRNDPIFLDVWRKLDKKDTKGIFSEPVSIDDVPDYYTVITNPMDFSTMRNKILSLQYCTLEEMELDFNLMIQNCKTFNEDKTVYFKTAVKLKAHGEKIFEEAKQKWHRRMNGGDMTSEEDNLQSPVPAPPIPASIVEEDAVESEDLKEETEVSVVVHKKEKKHESLQVVLNNILIKVDRYDTGAIFAEPIDTDEVPDYCTVINKPMDLKTMEEKISAQQYLSIDDLEEDFKLMVNNCKLYNEEDTKFYKMGVKVEREGGRVFTAMKKRYPYLCRPTDCQLANETADTHTLVGSTKSLEYEMQDDSCREISATEETESELTPFKTMRDLLEKLIEHDCDNIFAEPVSLEDVPDYLSVIKNPMDFSLMRTKLNTHQYSTLDEMQQDFDLMIFNCKKFNDRRTLYYKAAFSLKKYGDMSFSEAKERLEFCTKQRTT